MAGSATVEMVTLTSRDPGPPPYDYIKARAASSAT